MCYVLENRESEADVPAHLREHVGAPGRRLPAAAARHASLPRARRVEDPRVVVLTPGRLQQRLLRARVFRAADGRRARRAADLVVRDGFVQMRTTAGLQRVDVIYRRVGDDFLDPLVFRPDSLLGVPGVIRGVPRARRLGQRAGHGRRRRQGHLPLRRRRSSILPRPGCRSSRTCRRTCAPSDDDRAYVLDHLAELVVKADRRSGGYGMLIGPHSTRAASATTSPSASRQNPRGYIAQPTLSFRACRRSSTTSSKAGTSTCAPTFSTGGHLRAAGRAHARRAAGRARSS